MTASHAGTGGAPRSVLRMAPWAVAAALLPCGPPIPAAAQGGSPTADEGCSLCHGELELLRQQAPSLEVARTLLVPSGTLEGSAHDTMSCGSCHERFEAFPHPTAVIRTESCASCHEDARVPWSTGVHAPDEGAPCTACHGTHDVLPVRALEEDAGVRRMNGACVSCHDTSALPPSDPHADTVACASCHSPHATAAATGPASSVAPLVQPETCGDCHSEVADSARTDAHHRALADRDVASLALLRGGDGDAPPTCTSCHGAHGMLAPSHDRFDQDMVDRCATCHEEAADTYFGTYHGKATAVGSEIVATCDHCHGSHRIFPASDGRSQVAEANLVETCATCHERASASFVLYDSHPDPMDRSRNPPLFYSFVFMNVLLFGVLAVFTLHTALWWVRLMLDRRRGVNHGIGGGSHG